MRPAGGCWLDQAQISLPDPGGVVARAPWRRLHRDRQRRSGDGALRELGKPTGTFSTAIFALSSSVLNVLKGNHADISFLLAVKVPQGSPPFSFDNLRLAP